MRHSPCIFSSSSDHRATKSVFSKVHNPIIILALWFRPYGIRRGQVLLQPDRKRRLRLSAFSQLSELETSAFAAKLKVRYDGAGYVARRYRQLEALEGVPGDRFHVFHPLLHSVLGGPTVRAAEASVSSRPTR